MRNLLCMLALLPIAAGCFGERCDDGETFSTDAQRCVDKATLAPDYDAAINDAQSPDGGTADSSAQPSEDTGPQCDGVVDSCGVCDGPGSFWLYRDQDTDGLGDPDLRIEACEPTDGYVDNADDEYPECARPSGTVDCFAGQNSCDPASTNGRRRCVEDPAFPGCFDWTAVDGCSADGPLCMGDGSCAACEDDTHCTAFSQTPRCGDMGACVECSVPNEPTDCQPEEMCAYVGRCIRGAAGTSKRCTDLSMRSLLLDITETLGCQDNRQCSPGDACIVLPESSSELPEGTCLPLQAEAGETCPRGFKVPQNRLDVHGEQQAVCVPSVATCEETARAGDPCTQDDPLCVEIAGGGRFWTVPCQVDDDCPLASTCDSFGTGRCEL